MLYCEETVKSNIRNRDGKRVFYLKNEDTLTPSARDFLRREHIEILPAQQAKPTEYHLENGAFFQEKPEHFTHLRGNILVPKTHPVIAFRGAMDTLQAELLLSYAPVPSHMHQDLDALLTLARSIIRWDVMQEPAKVDSLCGMTEAQLRQRSHDPAKYYGIPHFMPASTDAPAILQLNLCRCHARTAERAAAQAYLDENGNCCRPDLLQALNRMSSMLYILMIRLKSGR